jgi:hypothetical protein
MKWCSFATLALLLGLNSLALAQAQTIERQAKGHTGRNINIGIFASIRADCTSGALPVIRLNASPAHGKVTVKQARLRATNFRQCLGIEVPAFVVIYRSSPGFIGSDILTLEVIKSGGKTQFQRITIAIEKPPVGQGI